MDKRDVSRIVTALESIAKSLLYFESMFCPNCGEKRRKDTTFCKCGRPIKNDS